MAQAIEPCAVLTASTDAHHHADGGQDQGKQNRNPGAENHPRQYEMEALPAPEVTAAEIVSIRKKLHMSQPVFARQISTSPDTLKNW